MEIIHKYRHSGVKPHMTVIKPSPTLFGPKPSKKCSAIKTRLGDARVLKKKNILIT